MKKIIVGTRNLAKISQIRGALVGTDIEVVGLPVNVTLPEVEENGLTAQENAKKKAMTYAAALGEVVLSMDNALYFDKLPAEKQPGIKVRRIDPLNDRPTDQAVSAYYQKLIATLGDRINGRWEFAICVAWPDGKMRETTIISPRIFVSHKSEKVIDGYPLESLQIDPTSGKYISEMTRDEQDFFWKKAIGGELKKFVESLESVREISTEISIK